MVRSVVREHHWPPDVIGGLYVDSQDFQGLEYWYEDVIKVSDELKTK